VTENLGGNIGALQFAGFCRQPGMASQSEVGHNQVIHCHSGLPNLATVLRAKLHTLDPRSEFEGCITPQSGPRLGAGVAFRNLDETSMLFGPSPERCFLQFTLSFGTGALGAPVFGTEINRLNAAVPET